MYHRIKAILPDPNDQLSILVIALFLASYPDENPIGSLSYQGKILFGGLLAFEEVVAVGGDVEQLLRLREKGEKLGLKSEGLFLG